MLHKIPVELRSPVQERKLSFTGDLSLVCYVFYKKENHIDISVWYHDTNPVYCVLLLASDGYVHFNAKSMSNMKVWFIHTVE